MPFGPTETSPVATEKAIVPKFSPTRPPADRCWQELLNAQPWPPLSTGAVAITSPIANEPMMIEPGELTPARPPSATLTAALLTVTSAFDPVIKPEWPPKSKVPFAPTSPPSIAPETVPPSTEPLAVTLLIVP